MATFYTDYTIEQYRQVVQMSRHIYGQAPEDDERLLNLLTDDSYLLCVGSYRGKVISALIARKYQKEYEIEELMASTFLFEAKPKLNTPPGAALLKSFIEHTRGSRLGLEVAESNRKAIQLYTQMGFEAQFLMKHYYGPNDHAYRMELT